MWSSASAQIHLAAVSGTVTDPQRQAVARAEVRVKESDTGIERRGFSDESGRFEFAGLAPGLYEVAVEVAGFEAYSAQFRLEVGQRMNLAVRLRLKEVSQSVEVQAGGELLKTNEASVGEVIESQAVRELPLNGRRLLDLAVTVPGAHHSHGAQSGDRNPLYWRPGQSSALSFAGSRPNANFFLLDGTTNTDPTFNTLNLAVSPDAVQEFQVLTGSYSAELGGAGGGQINIITRSGTSQLRGTLYHFIRNHAWDARRFNEMAEDHRLSSNQFGGSLGGPLSKGVFFFVNYEGSRRVENQTMIQTVPTEAEIAGDFSEAGAAIFDPATSRPNPAFNPSAPVSPDNPQIIRDPFPDNRIPTSRLHPVASIMLGKYTPRPNQMGDMGMNMTMMGQPIVFGAGMDSNNFMDVRAARHNDNQGTVRIDKTFEGGHLLAGRYSLSDEAGFTPENLPGFGAFHDNRAQHASLTWTQVLSANTVNVASFAFSRLAMHRYSENNPANDIVSELGIAGIGFGGKGAYGAPYFAIQGYSPIGDSYAATPMWPRGSILEGRDSFSRYRGAHSVKFGASYRWFMWPMWGFFQNRGYYQFTHGFTTQTATNDGTGSALAGFLLGLPAVRQRQAGIPSMDLRQWYADAFAQDTWRVTASTTLSLGLRYEYMSPLEDIARPWSNLFVDHGQLRAFIGGQAGMPRGLMHTNRFRFAPRLGLAHQHSSGTVIRAAYGIFYTPVNMNTWCNQLHNVPLVFPETNQSDNFVPGIFGFDFAPPVLGRTVVSYAAFDVRPPAQYAQQWSASLQRALGRNTTIEVGYLGARSFHLQRAHLINNAPPGPGPLQPRRPFQRASFIDGTVFPPDIVVASTSFLVSTVNLLENTARAWYDGGYVNVRRRYARGLSLLANYTLSKNLSDAPDFRSPMFESALPQDNANLRAEKGPSCDLRHRFAASLIYELPHLGTGWGRALLQGWRLSALLQMQSGFPFTISVFGDTANAGTLLGENPVRANYTGQPVFVPGTRTAARWFNPAAFAAPPAFQFGNVGRNTIYGPGMHTLDLALTRDFRLREQLSLQIRGEFYNALNRTNLGTPNRFVNTPQFGTITEAATPGRQIQLNARLSF